MLQIIIKALFWIVNTLANTLLMPVMFLLEIITFAWLQPFVSAFNSAVTVFNTYFIFFTDLLCIPRLLLESVFGIALAFFTWNITIKSIAMGMAVYRAFKGG